MSSKIVYFFEDFAMFLKKDIGVCFWKIQNNLAR